MYRVPFVNVTIHNFIYTIFLPLKYFLTFFSWLESFLSFYSPQTAVTAAAILSIKLAVLRYRISSFTYTNMTSRDQMTSHL